MARLEVDYDVRDYFTGASNACVCFFSLSLALGAVAIVRCSGKDGAHVWFAT